jgi:hypothetical protein
VRPLPAWGLYVRNVDRLELDNVRLRLEGNDRRSAFIAEGVKCLDLSRLVLPSAPPGDVQLKDVGMVQTPIVARKIAAKCVGLHTADPAAPLVASFEAGEPGLARVEVKFDGKLSSQWVWLASGKSDVSFAKPKEMLNPGKHRIQCGDVSIDVDVLGR